MEPHYKLMKYGKTSCIFSWARTIKDCGVCHGSPLLDLSPTLGIENWVNFLASAEGEGRGGYEQRYKKFQNKFQVFFSFYCWGETCNIFQIQQNTYSCNVVEVKFGLKTYLKLSFFVKVYFMYVADYSFVYVGSWSIVFFIKNMETIKSQNKFYSFSF